MALLNVQKVTLGFSSVPLLDGIDLQIHQGEKIALLGRNGAGKSTLMKIIDGVLEPDQGVIIRERNLKTALLPQEVPRGLVGTVRAVVAGGIPALAEPDHAADDHDEEKAHRRVDRALSHIGVDPDLVFENLSAGMKRRVIVGRTIADEPDILLLDEPTNHLDIDVIRWLEDFLARYERTIFFVTHDRAFLRKVANRIIEIDRGRLFDWKCDYETFLQRKEAWLESEETQNRLFNKKLAQEEIWIRKGIKARRTRNEGRVRALMQMRAERSARREVQGTVRIEAPGAGRSGRMVLEAENLSFAYGDSPVVEAVSVRIMRGDRIGIIGPNGCGKSTLVKLLLEELTPDRGTVRAGTRIECAYFDQMRDRLDESRTVRENVADGADIIDPGGRNRHVIGHLQDFLFTPDRADVPVSLLSGGEKNRLLLARVFTRPSNLLVMDEPTNDLDIETIELLEELLGEYEGTVLLVSHDRDFINNVVTSSLVFEGHGVVTEYTGGYNDWQLQRRAADGSAKDRKARDKQPIEKTKLTFKEKKELVDIPAKIEAHEKRVREIYTTLADQAFYQEGGPRVAAINTELATLESELEALIHRWDELESYET